MSRSLLKSDMVAVCDVLTVLNLDAMCLAVLKSNMVAVCDVSTVQNFDVKCLAVSCSQTWLLCVMYQQCRTLMLCVLQSSDASVEVGRRQSHADHPVGAGH